MKDIYQTYDAEQLAADEAFIRWVQIGAAADEAAWQAWLDVYPNKRPVVAEARRLVQNLKFSPEVANIDKDQLWNRIKASSQKEAIVKPINSRRRFLFGLGGAVAAAIALVLFIIFGLDSSQTIQTAFGEQVAQVLPDQSRVRINADSRLTYDGSGRQLKLEGEAYFEVTKGESFTVETPLGKVEVLGTEFNVFSRGDQFRVECTEGKVRVTTPGDQRGVTLLAATACFLNEEGKLTKILWKPEGPKVDWLDDVYRFKNQPLREVFAEMERQFDVEIATGESILSTAYTGAFDGKIKGKGIRQALEEVCWPLNLDFSLQGKKVTIFEKVDGTE
jgi:transmembrane sensor